MRLCIFLLTVGKLSAAESGSLEERGERHQGTGGSTTPSCGQLCKFGGACAAFDCV